MGGGQIALFLRTVDRMHKGDGSTVELQEEQRLRNSCFINLNLIFTAVVILNCCFVLKYSLNIVSHLHIFMDF